MKLGLWLLLGMVGCTSVRPRTISCWAEITNPESPSGWEYCVSGTETTREPSIIDFPPADEAKRLRHIGSILIQQKHIYDHDADHIDANEWRDVSVPEGKYFASAYPALTKTLCKLDEVLAIRDTGEMFCTKPHTRPVVEKEWSDNPVIEYNIERSKSNRQHDHHHRLLDPPRRPSLRDSDNLQLGIGSKQVRDALSQEWRD